MKLLQTTALVVLIFLGLSLSEAGMTETEPTYMPTLTVRDALKNVSEFEPEAEPDSTADEIPDPNMGGGAYAGLLLTDNEIRLLSSMVFLEANTQCFEGQQAVAEVALNRVLSPLFPDTVYDVLFQPEQFSVEVDDIIDTVMNGTKRPVRYDNEGRPSQSIFNSVCEVTINGFALIPTQKIDGFPISESRHFMQKNRQQRPLTAPF